MRRGAMSSMSNSVSFEWTPIAFDDPKHGEWVRASVRSTDGRELSWGMGAWAPSPEGGYQAKLSGQEYVDGIVSIADAKAYVEATFLLMEANDG